MKVRHLGWQKCCWAFRSKMQKMKYGYLGRTCRAFWLGFVIKVRLGWVKVGKVSLG